MRHSGVEQIMQFMQSAHLPPDLQTVAQYCEEAAVQVLNDIPEDSAELTAGLRKLLEAKDCFVRAKLMTRRGQLMVKEDTNANH